LSDNLIDIFGTKLGGAATLERTLERVESDFAQTDHWRTFEKVRDRHTREIHGPLLGGDLR